MALALGMRLASNLTSIAAFEKSKVQSTIIMLLFDSLDRVGR